MNAANSFSELMGNAIDHYHIRAKAPGSLGAGNVTINRRTDGRSASLYIDAPDAMADTATLYLNGLGYSGAGTDRLIMNADDTIAALWIDGVQMPPGTYTAAAGFIKDGCTGTLTVVPIIPTNPSPANRATVPAGDVVLSWTNLPPNVGDTDGYMLQDGPELVGVGARPPTSPTDSDTDKDRLNDGVETNTGTYLSATDTGTNPTVVDTDRDGLSDGAETNTGVFVSATDTGTDPTVTDSHSDGAGDWYEVAASFTDPTDPGDNPVVRYPLPDPDSTPPDTTKPVKVFILAGQSNMIGMGEIGGSQPWTLQTVAKQNNKFPHLVDDAGAWTARNDVYYYEARINDVGGPLTVPIPGSDTIGPETQFGHIMGYTLDEKLLLIKTAMGNRSLAFDFRPPSSGRNDPNSVWENLEYRLMIKDVNDVLTNIATILPDYQGQGYEIAGFCWFQGHKDSQNATDAAEYEWNLVNLINDVRTDFGVENLPVVIATVAFGGWETSGNYLTVANAQMAVSDPVKYPEFAGNVLTFDTRGYWREVEESPAD